MSEILLATLNAKYIHASFGLRYLMANMGDLQSRTRIEEFDINQRPVEIAERILSLNPTLIGMGIYIWNVQETYEVLSILKRVRPELMVILGGPEVSYETEGQAIVDLADFVITGEADLAFGKLCAELLMGSRPESKVIAASLPEPSQLILPYDWYHEEDLAHRVLYVEASRGCPFTCEFCLSSLDIPVRQFPIVPFLEGMQRLIDRGARQFKFVDRTFNLNIKTSLALMQFFLERYQPGMFFHFEMIPDRLPDELRQVIEKFPAGSLQFEVGIQTFNDEVGERIRRRQNVSRLEDNLRFLRERTGVHIHADLIVGLPGETLESFGKGFDRLVALDPQEIQVGMLKRLRGTPIIRHDQEWKMLYSPHAPYEILQTGAISFQDIQRMRRFAKYWDWMGNSGNFPESLSLLWENGSSPFNSFLAWSDWLYLKAGRTEGVALNRLFQFYFTYLTDVLDVDRTHAGRLLCQDYQADGKREVPGFLFDFRPEKIKKWSVTTLPKRQARHLTQS